MNPPPTKPPKVPMPPGFRAYVGLLTGILTAVTGVGTAGAIYLPKQLEEAAQRAATTAAREVSMAIKQDVTVLQQQMSTVNSTLDKIQAGVAESLNYMAEQERIKQVVWTLVKQEALKK